ncbi:MAG: rhomboid family intramembrane serine protease [Planctomycetes bacterium]|nr:rhomboid family intramembrane serine protease [Planctomycetota bacterium]
MIPLRDNIPSRTTPYVNYAILALTGVVFLLQQSVGGNALVDSLGMIPARVLEPAREIAFREPGGRVSFLEPALVWSWLTPLTCVFLHGGWLHFLGNMWTLWIFGDNVEDCMGHGRYALFYVAAGVLASLTHLVTNLHSTMPTVGASGAIAGVMGAYMLLYPRAQVLVLIPLFVLFFTAVVPAPLFLGVWFVLQFVQGVASVGQAPAGGVAWWAHIGGFAVGFAAAMLLRRRQAIRPPVDSMRPRSDRSGIYRIDLRRRDG